MTELTVSALDLDLVRKIRKNFTVRQYRFGKVGNGTFRVMLDLTANRDGEETSISCHRAFKNLDASKRYAKMIRAEVRA